MSKYFCVLFTILCLVSQSQAFEVHGHRGARDKFPENTLSGFHYAIESGSDFIEIDIQLTRDEELVIYHDFWVNKDLCIRPDEFKSKYRFSIPYISYIDLADLKTLDCGKKVNSKFPFQRSVPGQMVPTVEELLDMINSMETPSAEKVAINVEFKIPIIVSDSKLEIFLKKLVKIMDDKGFSKRFFIQSFDEDFLDLVLERYPDISVYQLVRSLDKGDIEDAAERGFTGVNPYYSSVKVQDMIFAKQNGIEVIPWTVNDKDEWEHLILMGAEGVITDRPGELRKFYNSFYMQNLLFLQGFFAPLF
ncbi:MAG: glycerophosphodiester phosphodiesterase [Bdellovibrionales bacterium]